MASIYNIQDWTTGISPNFTSFDVNEVVKYGGWHWYCTEAHANDANATYTPVKGSAKWDGAIYSTKLEKDVPHFFWNPSYGINQANSPTIRAIKFGDGYEQRIQDGVYTNLLKYSLQFEARNELETVAITHFLDARNGKDSFYFKTPPPHSVYKKFVCKSWSSTFAFKDNFNISAEFEEIS